MVLDFRDIKCAAKGCENKPRSQWEVGNAEARSWYCSQHFSSHSKFGVKTSNYILERIKLYRKVNEKRIRFVVRELIQNADDAGASTLVLRFEKDALYVANNGRWFSKEPAADGTLSDFDRVAEILNREKYDKKQYAGNFGSGFQTVFTITNLPEIHSHGILQILDPVAERALREDNARFSPYIRSEKEETRGVLFRFPWRDDQEALRVFDGFQPFADSDEWPRWRMDEIRDAYDDLKDYAHELILFCQFLRTFRVVWAVGDEREAYQVYRDFDLASEEPQPAKEVSVTEAKVGENSRWFGWDVGREERDCPPSFSAQVTKAKTSSVRRFLLASSAVKDSGGSEVRIKKDTSGKVMIGPGPPGKEEIKSNLVHLALPLDPSEDLAAKSHRYSVIPLPGESPNRFAFSAHFFPVESREDVDTEGHEGANKDWYRLCMTSLASLYRDAFGSLLSLVAASQASGEHKLRVIISDLPRRPLNEWMRSDTRPEEVEWARQASKDLFDWIFGQKWIVRESAAWATPSSAYSTPNGEDKSIVEILKLVAYPAEMLAFAKENANWLYERCTSEERRFGPDKLTRVWGEIVKGNGSTVFKGMRYGERYELPWSEEGLTLTKENLTPLINYALPHAAESMAIIPSAFGGLDRVAAFKKLPDGLEDVEALLPPDRRIHPDLKGVIAEIEKTNLLRIAVPVNEIPKLISEAVDAQPDRFALLSPTVQTTMSRALVALKRSNFSRIESIGFDRHAKKARWRFLPYRQGELLAVGEAPNLDETAEDRSSKGEVYERDWIFAKSRVEFESPPLEIESRIRFLELAGVEEKDAASVERHLLLAPLAATKGTPTVYARHFLSGAHGSLFEDDILSRFIEIKNHDTLNRVKKTMLKAVREYWSEKHTGEPELSPKKMGEVPCLYDQEGRWHKANQFALAGGAFASVLGYKTLSSEFAPPLWNEEMLTALGVVVKIGPEEVKAKVSELIADMASNRRKLATLFGAVLLHYSKDGLETLRRGLDRVQWVPIIGGGLADLSESLYPTKTNVSIVGEDFPTLVEASLIEADLSAELGKNEDDTISKLAALGLKGEPNIRDMLFAVSSYAKRGVRPPPKLLEELSSHRDGLSEQLRLPDHKFWWQERWYLGENIRILKEGDGELVTFDPARFLVLEESEATKFDRYLTWIRAEKKLLPADLLSGLNALSKARETSVESQARYDSLWERLDREEGPLPKIEEKIVWHKPSGSWHKPDSILAVDDEISDTAVPFEETLVLPRKEVGKALFRLGAHDIAQLSTKDSYGLLSGCVGKGGPTEMQVGVYVAMLFRGLSQKWWKSEWQLPFPCILRKGRVWVRPPNKGCVANQSLVSVFTEIPLIETRVGGTPSPSVEALASQAWGHPSAAEIVSYPDMAPGSYDDLQDLKNIIDLAWLAASKVFGPDSRNLGWLAEMEVRGVQGTEQDYSSRLGSGRFALPAIVPVEGERTALVVPKGHELGASDAELIAGWSVAAGFPESKRGDFARVLAEKIEGSSYQLRALEEAEEDRQEEIEARSVEYQSLIKVLRPIYLGCQICGNRTPRDDFSGDTQETIKRIFGKMNTLYKDEGPSSYELGNCLYLCPRHAKLASRQLIRFTVMGDPDEVESKRDELAKGLTPLIAGVQDSLDQSGLYRMEVDVYAWTALPGKAQDEERRAVQLLISRGFKVEGPARRVEDGGDGRAAEKPGWYPDVVYLTPDHAIKVYEGLLSRVKGA